MHRGEPGVSEAARRPHKRSFVSGARRRKALWDGGTTAVKEALFLATASATLTIESLRGPRLLMENQLCPGTQWCKHQHNMGGGRGRRGEGSRPWAIITVFKLSLTFTRPSSALWNLPGWSERGALSLPTRWTSRLAETLTMLMELSSRPSGQEMTLSPSQSHSSSPH